MYKILIVEDELYMLNLLNIHLGKEYDIITAKDGQIAYEVIQQQSFDLVILDVMLPYISGWDLCRKIREIGDTPILMLTARTDLSDKVKGLELGADDYLVKPFEFEELKARIKALFRRYNHMEIRNSYDDNKIIFLNGSFIIDLQSRQFIINQLLIELTAKEFDLLSLLASNPNHVYTREILLDKIWDLNEVRDVRNVDSHIK
ncbi:response regulator transcription factor, partial [Schinkia azotoformans]